MYKVETSGHFSVTEETEFSRKNGISIALVIHSFDGFKARISPKMNFQTGF